MEVCFLFLNSTTNNSKNGNNNNNNNNNSSSVVARSVACGERNLDLPESVASTDPVHVGNWRVVEAAVPPNLGCRDSLDALNGGHAVRLRNKNRDRPTAVPIPIFVRRPLEVTE